MWKAVIKVRPALSICLVAIAIALLVVGNDSLPLRFAGLGLIGLAVAVARSRGKGESKAIINSGEALKRKQKFPLLGAILFALMLGSWGFIIVSGNIGYYSYFVIYVPTAMTLAFICYAFYFFFIKPK